MDSDSPAPFDYIRDDASCRIRIAAHRALRIVELLSIVDRQADEGTWTYAVVYDMRQTHSALPPPDADALAARVSLHIVSHGPRGPVAVVSRTPAVIGAMQMYAFHAALAGVEVQVFWEQHEAEHWLDGVQARQPG
jgi:hypothetical protein